MTKISGMEFVPVLLITLALASFVAANSEDVQTRQRLDQSFNEAFHDKKSKLLTRKLNPFLVQREIPRVAEIVSRKRNERRAFGPLVQPKWINSNNIRTATTNNKKQTLDHPTTVSKRYNDDASSDKSPSKRRMLGYHHRQRNAHLDFTGFAQTAHSTRQINTKEQRMLVNKRDDITTNEACEGGRRITCKQGMVMSPGYPESYYGNDNCSWHILADSGKVIEVDFVDFTLTGGDCGATDYVSLTDTGSAVSDSQPVVLCGNNKLPKFKSVGNEVVIRFVSDAQDENRGFLFSYLTRDPITCEDTIEVTGQSGSLTSENYPDFYKPNSNCHWRIVTPIGSRISISFNDVALEHARSCEWDGVELFDGPSRDHRSLGTFCGREMTRNVTSSDNSVYVVLMSDGSGEDRGFSLNWNAIFF